MLYLFAYFIFIYIADFLRYSYHGKPFVAAVEKGAILSCQFHPELSGPYGESILRNWIEKSPSLVGHSIDVPTSPLPLFAHAGVTRRVIPCLDVKDGMVVKGIKFQDLKESGVPSERAALYQLQGGDEIVILGLSCPFISTKTHLLYPLVFMLLLWYLLVRIFILIV